MKWFVCENPELKGLPKWQRSTGLSSDGVVYVPAALAGNETAIFYCALNDCIPVENYLNHRYVPADWLAREYPKTAELCEIFIKIREKCQ